MKPQRVRRALQSAATTIARPFSEGRFAEIGRLRALARARRDASLEAFRRRLRKDEPLPQAR
jgi:hypothetical protein